MKKDMSKKVLFILIHPKTINNFYDILFEKVAEKYELHILTVRAEIVKQLKEAYTFHYFDIATNNVVDFIKMTSSIYRTIKKVKPNIVIGFTIRNTIFSNIICRHLKIPTISPIVGLGQLYTSNEKVYRVARFLLPYALQKTSHIFFYNDDDMIFFLKRKMAKASYSRINGNGVNVEKFKPTENQNNEKTIFLLVARLLYDKGIKEYCEAARIIKGKYPDVRFQILGCFYDQNLAANQISRDFIKYWQKAGTIEYLGCVDDVRSYMAKSDCIILPSYREGLSNVLMEGGSMSKPLLSTNVPGCKELIIDNYNGFIFQAKSAVAIANTCSKFLKLSIFDRNRMGRNSRSLMVEKFNRLDSVNKYLEKIGEIII